MVIGPVVSEILGGRYHPPQMLLHCQKEQMLLTVKLFFSPYLEPLYIEHLSIPNQYFGPVAQNISLSQTFHSENYENHTNLYKNPRITETFCIPSQKQDC